VPSQERAQRTCARIVEAAAKEFSERGYAATTTRSIAERAGVATGSFYQYFHDKDAVLLDIARRRIERIARGSVERLEIEAPPGANLERARVELRAVVDLVIAFHRDDPGLHAVLTERRHADPTLDALTSEAERSLVERIGALLGRWGLERDPLAMAFVVFGMVEGSVHAHVLGGAIVDDERFVAALVEALSRIAFPTRFEAPKETTSWRSSS
jgi:AcrR family transcriptional regulator